VRASRSTHRRGLPPERDSAQGERRDQSDSRQTRLGNRAVALALAGGGSIPTMTVPFVTALQRSAGNRAAQQLIGSARRVAPPTRDQVFSVQRYSIINPADYALGAGSRFSTQQLVIGPGAARYEQETREQTAGGQVETKKHATGQGAWATTANRAPSVAPLPSLKYGSDGVNAIGLEHTAAEPKVFYATPGVVTTSNAKLESLSSEARLADAGGSMTAPQDPAVPLGPTLNLHMIKPGKAQTGGPPIVLEKFGEISECNSFIKYIVGNFSERVAVFGAGAGHEALADEEKEPTQDIATFAGAGAGTGQNLAQHLTTTGARRSDHDQPLPNAYTNMVGKQARDTTLGINSGAKASVGEGYVITQGGDMPGTVQLQEFLDALDKKIANAHMTQGELDMFKKKWAYHYAGVVANVGDDGITLENYNRGTPQNWALDDLYNEKIANVVGLRNHLDTLANNGRTIPSVQKLRNQWFRDLAEELRKLGATAGVDEQASLVALDQVAVGVKGLEVQPADLWYFKMYGTGAGQSFHENWQSAVDDPMTLRIRQSNVLSKTRWKAVLTRARDDLGALGPSPAALRRLQVLQLRDLADLDQAINSTTIQQAWLSGQERAQGTILVAMHDWATDAAALMGKQTSAVPAVPQLVGYAANALTNYANQLSPLIQGWEAKGWAVTSKSKTKLADKRTKLANLRQAIITASAIALNP
jgi:hypothetical protein